MSSRRHRRFVLAHGFTQTARSWDTISALLAERLPGAEIRAIDLPGHGAAADQRGDLWDSAQRMLDIGDAGTYIGYSMGARVALHAALLDPGSVERLVLIGATAGIDDEAERTARRVSDEHLADRIESIGVEAFVDEWLDNALFAGLTSADNLRDDRLRNTEAGLAASLRSTGTGTQEPMWDRLVDVVCPTLVLAGGNDVKFTELGRRLAASLRHGEMIVVPGVGHSVHLEAPESTVETIASWLR